MLSGAPAGRATADQPLLAARPGETQANTSNTRNDGPSESWNGEFYCSFGHSSTSSWLDAQAFGFICGGGGTWYSNGLKMLASGDRVWVNIPQQGYVGVGRVAGRTTAAADFTVPYNGIDTPVLQAATRGTYHAEHSNDPTLCEYFVPVEWLQTVPVQRSRPVRQSKHRLPPHYAQVALDDRAVEGTFAQKGAMIAKVIRFICGQAIGSGN